MPARCGVDPFCASGVSEPHMMEPTLAGGERGDSMDRDRGTGLVLRNLQHRHKHHTAKQNKRIAKHIATPYYTVAIIQILKTKPSCKRYMQPESIEELPSRIERRRVIEGVGMS